MLLDPWLLDAAAETEFLTSGGRFDTRLTSNSFNVMKEATRSGLAIGFFTKVGFIEEIRRGELIHVPLSEPQLARSEMGVFVHRKRRTSPAIAVLVRGLETEFSAVAAEMGALDRPSRRARPARERISASPRAK